MVVFDITRPATLESAAKWKADIDAKVSLPNGERLPVLLLGNKVDLVQDRARDTELTDQVLHDFCTEHGFVGYLDVSAKDNFNVSARFFCFFRFFVCFFCFVLFGFLLFCSPTSLFIVPHPPTSACGIAPDRKEHQIVDHQADGDRLHCPAEHSQCVLIRLGLARVIGLVDRRWRLVQLLIISLVRLLFVKICTFSLIAIRAAATD